MSSRKRIENILLGILMILVAAIMIILPETGLVIAVVIVSFVLLLRGFHQLFYFLTMARHMTGGKIALIEGILYLDSGLFLNVTSLYSVSRTAILLYLIIFHGFTAVIRIMRASETRKEGVSKWKKTLFQGIFNAAVCILCFVFFKNTNVVVWIFAVDLIISACDRISDSFRRSAVVYIQ